MKTPQPKPDTRRALARLKDFQRQTVDYVYHHLYEAEDRVDRFLIADEVGLGKTLVAKGVIAKAVDRLWLERERIDILYICANRDIARQNINRLNITEREIAVASRMTLLPLYLRRLQDNRLNFVSFTPGTSFNLRSRGGVREERILLYHLLKRAWNFGETAGPKNLFQMNIRKRETWRWELANFSWKNVDESLADSFTQSLQKNRALRRRFDDLVVHFSHYRKRSNIPDQPLQEQLAFIGELRRLLAKSCVDALEPDIVILDEFQRFKNLLSTKSTLF